MLGYSRETIIMVRNQKTVKIRKSLTRTHHVQENHIRTPLHQHCEFEIGVSKESSDIIDIAERQLLEEIPNTGIHIQGYSAALSSGTVRTRPGIFGKNILR